MESRVAEAAELPAVAVRAGEDGSAPERPDAREVWHLVHHAGGEQHPAGVDHRPVHERHAEAAGRLVLVEAVNADGGPLLLAAFPGSEPVAVILLGELSDGDSQAAHLCLFRFARFVDRGTRLRQ